MKDSERFLIILVALLVLSLLLFLWDQNGRLQKTIQILHDDKKVQLSPPHPPVRLLCHRCPVLFPVAHPLVKDATTARDAALEKLKASDARIATDMHAVNARHSVQSAALAACTSDRVAFIEAMKDVSACLIRSLFGSRSVHNYGDKDERSPRFR